MKRPVRRPLGIGALALMCLMSVAAAGQLATPARVIERPEAVFPPAAKAVNVDGDVSFRASVDVAGRVQSVEILTVPQTGLGFEESVRAAVTRWRFSPALLRGVPTQSTYDGTVRFFLTLPGQAIFAASSKDTWTAVRTLVRQLKIPVEKTDDTHQLLTSGRVSYGAVKLPNWTSLDLPLGFKPDRLVFHIYVAPGMEPARVAVGSVMDLESVSPNNRKRLVMYGHEQVARWFLTELARQMGVRQEALWASADGRAAQARSLMPAGLTDPCATSPAALADLPKRGDKPDGTTAAIPRVLQQITPMYPQDQLDQRRTAKIVFHGEITEHGTLVNPTMTDPPDAPQSFVSAAQLAFGLWRFTPAQRDGCPVRVNAGFESAFSLGK